MAAIDPLRPLAICLTKWSMNIVRALAPVVLLPALSGCTRDIDVKLAFLGGQPVLTFYTQGWFPRRLDSVCLWTTEVIDDLSGKVALKLSAIDSDQNCVRVSEVTFNRQQRGLVEVGKFSGLVQGRSYHAEVIAEEGMGRSDPWVQP